MVLFDALSALSETLLGLRLKDDVEEDPTAPCTPTKHGQQKNSTSSRQPGSLSVSPITRRMPARLNYSQEDEEEDKKTLSPLETKESLFSVPYTDLRAKLVEDDTEKVVPAVHRMTSPRKIKDEALDSPLEVGSPTLKIDESFKYPSLPSLTPSSQSLALTLEQTLTTYSSHSTLFSSAPFHHNLPLRPHQEHGLVFLSAIEERNETGGILADDMGLGKTLITIALIASRASLLKANHDYLPATLVILPLCILHQWANELQSFAPQLKVRKHHGLTKIKGPSELDGVDVVITTYERVVSEHGSYASVDEDKKRLGYCVLFLIKWGRVILDEAHRIRNKATKVSIACRALTKLYGHCITGTPAQNSIEDLYPLMHFLNVPYFNDFSRFTAFISEPVRRGNWYGPYRRLLPFLQERLIRRTKDTKINGASILPLKGRIDEFIKCEMTGKQLDTYHFVHEHYDPHPLVKTILLRLVCDSPILVRKFVEDNAAFMEGDVSFESMKDACDGLHEFVDILDEMNLRLPQLCGKCNASKDTTHDVDCTTSGLSVLARSSSKVVNACSIIFDIISRTSVKGSPDKSIIVSKFVKTLDLFVEVFQERSIGFERFDGSMSTHQRDQTLRRLNNDPSVVVLLMSLDAGGVGLNITCCNHLILMEPWWNPYAEDQAFGRIYRMGQKKDVFIYRLYCPDTIEHRMLEVQLKKRTQISSAFGGWAADSVTEACKDIEWLSSELGDPSKFQ